jgi:hypothetical protein
MRVGGIPFILLQCSYLAPIFTRVEGLGKACRCLILKLEPAKFALGRSRCLWLHMWKGLLQLNDLDLIVVRGGVSPSRIFHHQVKLQKGTIDPHAPDYLRAQGYSANRYQA